MPRDGKQMALSRNVTNTRKQFEINHARKVSSPIMTKQVSSAWRMSSMSRLRNWRRGQQVVNRKRQKRRASRKRLSRKVQQHLSQNSI